MKAIKNVNAFKKSLLSATNGNMVESFDSSTQFGGCEYQSYRVYVDDVHYYNMFVIYNFATNTYDVSLETSTCAVSTMSRVCKTQKAMIDSVVRWCYFSYLNTKEISVDSEEYTDRCTESEKTETNKIKGYIYIDTDSVKVAPLPEQQTSEESITDTIIADDNSSYNIEVLRAKQELNTKYGNSYRKHLHAIINPEWHHVSLATLANIDNDMLDEKRRNYMYLYNLIKDFRKYAFEIIRKDVYFETTRNVFRNIQQLYFNNVISFTTYDYAAKHIQTVGIEKGWFDSKSEETFGYKESRRYKVTLR